jgi:hypothetical protein
MGNSGHELSDDDKFYLNWARETLKNNIALANSTLSQLLVLCTALMGSGVYFLTDKVLPGWALISTLSLLFISLLAALFSVMPHRADVNMSSPSEIKEHKKLVLNTKLRYIKYCVFPLVAALFIAAAGTITRALST